MLYHCHSLGKVLSPVFTLDELQYTRLPHVPTPAETCHITFEDDRGNDVMSSWYPCTLKSPRILGLTLSFRH